ncbi:MAG: hypothetical protein F4Y03_11570, partial [Alphaproteobacteria bacterium]|nr:hypothetical protein [Alphaproteobacteria bacterium]
MTGLPVSAAQASAGLSASRRSRRNHMSTGPPRRSSRFAKASDSLRPCRQMHETPVPRSQYPAPPGMSSTPPAQYCAGRLRSPPACHSTGPLPMPRNCRSLAFAVALLALIPAILTPASADPLSITLVHVNDWDRMEGVDGRGGAAKIAAVVSEERARAEKAGGLAIVTFGGDMISPSLLSGLDRGEHMIELANAIGFDIAVLGNHEFDFGPEVLKERLEQSQTVWLAGNVRYRGEPGFPGAGTVKIVEHGGYRIGFLGLVTPETAKISSPGKDVTFTPFVETGAALAAELREAGADLVVALTHNDLAHDLELLRVSGGIDAVLGGHD